jgi:perosamine synthetase
MKSKKITRRQVVATATAGFLGAMISLPFRSFGINNNIQLKKLAVNGGEKTHTGSWPKWPYWDQSAEPGILDMFRSGRWWRGDGEYVSEFEKKYAALMGAKHCLATASGTTALTTALGVLGVDAGDEVLVSPYTFIASYNAIFVHKALPVFVDSDPETFLMDPNKIEGRITDRTVAILPVHIYGLPVDMDSVNKVARSHNLKVVEDACQAWLAEYRGKRTGTLGDLGCFSFQNSKHLPAGGYNYRMKQSQALILMSQMKRFENDNDIRLSNALYLDKKLKEIPGIIPYKLADGASRAVYHLYPFRYIKEMYNNVPKDKFLRALSAEGIPCSSGYGKQNNDGLFEEAFSSRGYKRLFSESRLKQWRDENILPGNDQLSDQAVTFSQSLLLGSKADMDDIVNAITKIYENRESLI